MIYNKYMNTNVYIYMFICKLTYEKTYIVKRVPG